MTVFKADYWVSLCVFVLLVFVASCRKEKLSVEKLYAKFQIIEQSYDPAFWGVQLYDTDSVSTGEVSFIADGPDVDSVQYLWQIGTDSRTFKGKSLALDFRYAPTDTITVLLTAIRWNSAYTIQLEKATVRRTFYLRRKSQILGTFEGSFEDKPKQKVLLKIQDQFIHPLYYESHYDAYIGLLISTDLPGRDTIFISNSESGHYVFNRKLSFIHNSITIYERYQFNRWVQGFDGDAIVDNKTKLMNMSFRAQEVATGKEVTVKFAGKKVN
jgi:hypothetical protein